MLKVSVKDFGPIVEGEVTLKPLTIFVGPSNAGKSYLAMLIYSLMQSFSTASNHGILRFLAGRRIPPDTDEDVDVNDSTLAVVSDWIRRADPDSIEELALLDLPEEIRGQVDGMITPLLKSTGRLFGRELQRCHGNVSDARNRRAGAARLEISLEQDHPLLRLNFEEDEGVLHDPTTEWDVSQPKLSLLGSWVSSLNVKWSEAGLRPSEALRMNPDFFLRSLAMGASATLFQDFPGNCYYLPAARSGITQGHKAIASILVRQSSFAAVRPMEIPTLSGIITDFMSHILTMERGGDWPPVPPDTEETGEMSQVVDFFEREVVRGRVDIERSGEVTYPEISYAPLSESRDAGKFPFHRTSSMVSELAPVILFLKHLVRPRDLVILEEPESHLHPASQRQMARGIARLVNAGVKVIITTHSDYLIDQINNLLKLSRASRQKLKKEGYAAKDCLRSEDVGAYYFRMDDGLGGSRVEELPIVPGFGIEEQDLAEVSEALYNETVSLQRIRSS